MANGIRYDTTDDNLYIRSRSHGSRHRTKINSKSLNRAKSSQPYKKRRVQYDKKSTKKSKHFCGQFKSLLKLFSAPFSKSTKKHTSRLISSNSTMCTTSISFSVERSHLKNSHRPLCPEEVTNDALTHHYKKAYYWDKEGNLRKKYFLPSKNNREDWSCFQKSNKAANLTLKTTSTSSFLKSSNPASKIQLLPKRSYQGFSSAQRFSDHSDLSKKFEDSRDSLLPQDPVQGDSAYGLHSFYDRHMKGGIQARTTWRMYGSPTGASSSEVKDEITEGFESGVLQDSECDIKNSSMRSSTFTVQPPAKDLNANKYLSAGSRSSSNTGREDTRLNLKGNVKAMFIPMDSDRPQLEITGKFSQIDKVINWTAIKFRKDKVEENKHEIEEIEAKEAKRKAILWKKRIEIGIIKRKLQKANPCVRPCKVRGMLSDRFHNIIWFADENSSNTKQLGRFFDKEQSTVVTLKAYKNPSQLPLETKLENKLATLQEISCLQNFSHENVIRLITYFELQDNPYLILEPCEQNLRYEIAQYKRGLHPPKVKRIILQVVLGLCHCHSKHYVHCDLCPESILIAKNGVVKLANFDHAIARPSDSYNASDTSVKSRSSENSNHSNDIKPGVHMAYTAPEILVGSDCIEFSADIWSLGAVTCELLKGKPLWSEPTKKDQLQQIEDALGPLPSRRHFCLPKLLESFEPPEEWSNLREFLPRIPENAFSFISKCLDVAPKRRASAAALLQQPFLGYAPPIPRENNNVESRKNLSSAINEMLEDEGRPQTAPFNNYCPPLNVKPRPKPIVSKKLSGKHERFEDQKACSQSLQTLPPVPPKQTQHPPWERKLCFDEAKKHVIREQTVPLVYDAIFAGKSVNDARDDHVGTSASKGTGKKKVKNKSVTFACEETESERKETRRNKLMHRSSNNALKQSMPHLINSISRTNWSNVEMISTQLVTVAERYPGAFLHNVNQLTSTLISHISSTKTAVAGPAIRILKNVYDKQGHLFENETERIVHTLLSKLNGPSFIDKESQEILSYIAVTIQPNKACQAFCKAATHKLPASRYVASTFVVSIMRKMDLITELGDRTVNQRKLTGAIFDAAQKFCKDPSPGTRTMAKDIFKILMEHPNFWDLYRMYVRSDQRVSIDRILGEIRAGRYFY